GDAIVEVLPCRRVPGTEVIPEPRIERGADLRRITLVLVGKIFTETTHLSLPDFEGFRIFAVARLQNFGAELTGGFPLSHISKVRKIECRTKHGIVNFFLADSAKQLMKCPGRVSPQFFVADNRKI